MPLSRLWCSPKTHIQSFSRMSVTCAVQDHPFWNSVLTYSFSDPGSPSQLYMFGQMTFRVRGCFWGESYSDCAMQRMIMCRQEGRQADRPTFLEAIRDNLFLIRLIVFPLVVVYGRYDSFTRTPHPPPPLVWALPRKALIKEPHPLGARPNLEIHFGQELRECARCQ